jgi:hypothetical protein
MNYKITHIIGALRWKMTMLVVFLVLGGQSVWGQGYRIYYDATLFCCKGGTVVFTYKTGNDNEVYVSQLNYYSGNLSCKGVINIDDRSKFYGNYTFIFTLYGVSSYSRNEYNACCYEHATGGDGSYNNNCNIGIRATEKLFTFYPVFTNALPSKSVGVLPLNDKISLSSSLSECGSNLYGWEYSVEGSPWQPLPAGYNHSQTIYFSALDILGSKANDCIDKNISLRLNAFGRSLPDGISKTVNYKIVASPPHITDINPIAPKCSTENGKVSIKIDRELADLETLHLELYDTDGKDHYLTSIDLTSNKISEGVPYVCDFNLDQGKTYYIKYLSLFRKSDGTNSQSELITPTTSNDYFSIGTVYPVTFTAKPTNITCNGSKNGTITLSATGGTGSGYEYNIAPSLEWTGFSNSTTPQITGRAKGSYTLKVKDSNGCESAVADVEIKEPDPLTITYQPPTNVYKFGSADGSISVTADGGTPPYAYAWADENGQPAGNTSVASNLKSGTYTLTLTDGNYSTASPNTGCVCLVNRLLLNNPTNWLLVAIVHLISVMENQMERLQ